MPEKKQLTRLLFIDANIYLRFYDNNARNYKNLLKSVLEVKDRIFVTPQIANEVQRNKLSIFVATYKSHLDQFKFTKATLPEHMTPSSDDLLSKLNTETERLEKEIKDHKKKLQDMVEKIVLDISQNADEVSVSLKNIFATKTNPSLSEVTAARFRKEVGNPPGKSDDPLGDQLSWEQLLNHVSGADEVYIISNDYDYISIFEQQCYLNPLLLEEILQRKKDLQVYCFNTLAEALKKLNTSKKIESLPAPEKLEVIAKEEKQSNQLNSLLTSNNNLLNESYFDKITKAREYITFHGGHENALGLASSGSLFDYIKFNTPADLVTALSMIEQPTPTSFVSLAAVSAIRCDTCGGELLPFPTPSGVKYQCPACPPKHLEGNS